MIAPAFVENAGRFSIFHFHTSLLFIAAGPHFGRVRAARDDTPDFRADGQGASRDIAVAKRPASGDDFPHFGISPRHAWPPPFSFAFSRDASPSFYFSFLFFSLGALFPKR